MTPTKPDSQHAALNALARRRARFWIIALGVALMAPSVTAHFVFDDDTHALMLREHPGVAGLRHGWLDLFVFVPGTAAENRAMIDEGTVLPWWASLDLKLAFFRPLSSATHALDWMLWPGSARLMHLHNLVWYALLLGVVALVYRRFCQPAWLSGLALLLYAVDDAHSQTVGWIANRNALIASVFALLALVAHDRWRRDGWLLGAVLGPVCLLLGLLGAEFAIGVCAYLFAYALFVDRGRGRFTALLPYAVVIVPWRIVYRALGYGVRSSDAYIDPGLDPVPFLTMLPKRVLMLLLGQFGAPGADTAFWKPPHEHWILIALGLLTVLLIGWLLWPIVKKDGFARFWALGLVLATVPVSASFSSDRVLLLVGVGAMALLARLFGDTLGAVRAGERLPRVKLLLVTGYALLHLPVAAVLTPFRARLLELSARALERAESGIPSDASIRTKTVVIVNAPVDAFVSFIQLTRERRGVPRPAHLHALASATSPIEVTRVDDRTLRVRPARGFLYTETERFWRAKRNTLHVGDRVELPTLTAEITESTGDGRPAAAEFHFHAPLDAPDYVFRCFRDGSYVPWVPPPIGRGENFPAEDFVSIVLREGAR